MAFNMRPGCSPSDIPGNHPEDQRAEEFYERLYVQAGALSDDSRFEVLADWIWAEMGRAYAEGYQQALADEAMAQAMIKRA